MNNYTAYSWLDVLQIQRFDHLYDARPSATLSLGVVLDAIVDGTYATDIIRLRQLYASHGEDAYAAAKRRLPQITFGGTFAPTRAKANLTQHSGIVHADLDHLGALQETKLQLMQDPHTAYCFCSPRGDGLKYGVRIAPVVSDDAYQHAWQALADAHLRLHAVTWDPSGKDTCRLCFVSWDPSCYINPDAEAYAIPPMVTPPPPPVAAYRHWPSPRLHTAAQRALERAVQMIARATPGEKHAVRCRAAYLVGGYLASGELAYAAAHQALHEVVSATSNNQRKAMRDIVDGLSAGQARPITTPSRHADHWRYRAITRKERSSWQK